MKQTTSKRFAGLAGALVVLGILVAVNALLAGVRLRRDLTAEKLYTLSPATVAMLQGLERPVTLKFFFSRGQADLPAPLKNYVQRTRDFLREVAGRSGGNVVLEMWDPQPDSDAEEWAQRYGLMPQATGGLGLQPDLYLGLVAVSGAKEAAIPFLDPGAEPQMEYLVARLVQEVVRERRPRVGLMSSLPVLAPPLSPFLPPARRGQDWLFVSELKTQFEVEPVAPEVAEIPAGLDALLVVHPKNLSETTLYALDQYVLKGGRLVAYLDPMCISEEPPANQMGMPAMSSDLNRLTRAWGVEMDAGRVVADLAAATPVNLGDGRAERLPAWLTLRGEPNLDRTDVATAPLEHLMLPFAGAITGTPAEGLEMTTLMAASADAVTLSTFQARDPASLNTRQGVPAPAAALAVRLTGRFPTAFPDGPPRPAGATNEMAEAGGLREAEMPGVVVLVADADLLANDVSARGINLFGQTLYQPFNDNLNFTLNLAEQMTGDPALIGLRSRGRYGRPFERVLAMEREAQARWQEQEERLQRKLEETQMRLNELQAAKSDDQQLVLSAAQKAELEKFRQERFETQRQLKEVRKNLRSSIERLGLGLKALNMAAVPLGVAGFGIVHGWRRRRRAAA
jgi:ABC-type uncharacterized transport system involved in gliding motility auxiliary subunit